ncbi:MAG: site-specific integrase [Dehalococcoidales bacterium]
MDDKAKRRLSLKRKTNHELFSLYYDHLKVRLTPGQFDQYTLILDKYHQFLGEFPPSVELATQFLTRYTNHAQATLVRYAGMIRGFMEWYGESLDIRPAKPKSLPQYVEPNDIEHLIDIIRHKNTHKRTVERDVLLVRFATLTGLRRSELAHLTVGDIHIKQKVVIVRKGKGNKDRVVPLVSSLCTTLTEYTRDMKPIDSVFGLTERSITDKISTWSKKAGLNLHPHSFRHFFAEQLLDKGVPLTVVSDLLGHENLQTTSSYLGLKPGALREAIDKLDEPQDEKENKSSRIQDETDHDISDQKSLRAHVEKLAEAYERLSKAEEKKAYDQDPAKGIHSVVYPKSNTKPKKKKNSTDPFSE